MAGGDAVSGGDAPELSREDITLAARGLYGLPVNSSGRILVRNEQLEAAQHLSSKEFLEYFMQSTHRLIDKQYLEANVLTEVTETATDVVGSDAIPL